MTVRLEIDVLQWESGGIAPCVLILGSRWRWVISFTPRPLYSRGKSPRYPLGRMCWREQYPCPRQESKPGRPARSPVTILTGFIKLVEHIAGGALGHTDIRHAYKDIPHFGNKPDRIKSAPGRNWQQMSRILTFVPKLLHISTPIKTKRRWLGCNSKVKHWTELQPNCLAYITAHTTPPSPCYLHTILSKVAVSVKIKHSVAVLRSLRLARQGSFDLDPLCLL